jgi:hypothetical protein
VAEKTGEGTGDYTGTMQGASSLFRETQEKRRWETQVFLMAFNFKGNRRKQSYH